MISGTRQHKKVQTKKRTTKRSTAKRTRSGGGGLSLFGGFNFTRSIPLIVILAIVGSAMVFTSMASSSKTEVTTWYRTCLNREPDSDGLAYWSGRLDKGEATWTVAAAFMASAEKTSCIYKNEPKTPPQTKTYTTKQNETTVTGTTSTTTPATTSDAQYYTVVQSFYKSCSYSSTPAASSDSAKYWIGQLKTKSQQSVWENFRTTSRNNGLLCADNVGGAVPKSGTGGSTGNTNTTQITKQQEATVASFYRSCNYTSVPGSSSSAMQYWVGQLQSKSIQSVWENFRTTSRNNGLDCANDIGGTIVKVVTNDENKNNTGGDTKHDATVTSFYKSCTYPNVPARTSSNFQYWVNELKTKPQQSVWENFRTTSRNNGLLCADAVGGPINSKADTGKKITQNPYVCNSPYPTIAPGSKDSSGGRKDACVSAVQFNLAIASPDVKVTGVADDSTVKAIRSFQSFFKQTVDGTLTPAQVKSIADIWGVYRTDGSKSDEKKDEKKKNSSSSGGSSGVVDVTFVARDGVSETDLAATAAKFLDYAKKTSPLSDYTYATHYITSDDVSLNCETFTSQTAQGPTTHQTCSGLDKTVAGAGAPVDYIFLVNTYMERAHAGGNRAVVGLNDSGWVLVHEFAHLIGLEDEYVSRATDPVGTPSAQCFASKNSQEEIALSDGTWKNSGGSWNEYYGSVDGIEFHKGCTYPSWWRPSRTSLMEAHGYPSFNSVSQRYIPNHIIQ